MSLREVQAQARASLPRAWHAFYARFGRLREIQARAVEPLLAGRDTLLVAPTASGKTEAALAPLVEGILARRSPGLQVIVVSPTRALVNDLHRRLEPPLRQLGVALERKSGDTPSFDATRPILITTPESLDSLLCRRTRALRGVRAVVLDELHLLDGTVRGDQLRVLLERLERVAETRPQRCALSATVPQPQPLAGRWLSRPEILVQGGEGRRIRGRLARALSLEEATARLRASWPEQGRKILVFANARAQVEALSALLSRAPELQGRVFAHHGSLSRDERLRVERGFLRAHAAICVATMTLELGIDIGDVDLVALLSPPPDVGSLLQRAGRGNRKSEETRVLALYADPFEAARLRHLLRCGGDGRLFESSVAFRPTVLAQQALGLAFQNPRRWISAEVLRDRLPPDLRADFGTREVESVLDALVEAGHLRPTQADRFTIDEGAERLFERGRLHSLIDDSPETAIVDALTGRRLGTARVAKAQKVGGGSLALGGRRRQISHVRDNTVFVKSAEGLGEAQFISREAPRYSAGLATDLGRSLGLGPDELRFEAIGDRWRLAHFMGTLWGNLLDGLLLRRGLKGKAPVGGPFFTWLESEPPEGPLLEDASGLTAQLRSVALSRSASLARRLGAGAFRKVVPPSLIESWVLASVDHEALAHRLASCHLVQAPLLLPEV